MTRRVLDVSIRSEFRKGFGDIAKAMSSLEGKLGNIAKLSESVNRLANNMDGALAMKQAQQGLKKTSDAQTKLNKSVSEGVRTAKLYESAHTSLGNKLGAVASAQKAGSVSSKQRMEAEIGLLNKYIKKTGDLSVLQNKNKFRDSKGQFVAFSKGSLDAVKATIASSVEDGIKAGATRGAAELAAQMRITAGRVQAALSSIRPASGLSTKAVVERNSGVGRQSTKTSARQYEDLFNSPAYTKYAKRNDLDEGFAKSADSATRAAGRIRSLNFGPNNAKSEPAFKRLADSYTRLGHFIFQLQYSTMTLFGATGIAMIAQQADALITLRNQVGRTSKDFEELGVNMKDVYKISMATFSDPKSVGKIFSTINKYADDLKLSQKEVAGTTGAIAGAFAASPGNAEEKRASQYQFMQAIQSNRLGGDELRSVLEMAPYVGDILAKQLAKDRGMPAGSVIDLRAQAKPGADAIDTKELVKVFNNPSVQAEIRQTLGRQARTFGDLMMVGKTRLMMLTEQFANGTGVFSGLINMISSFISDDTKFKNFTDALVAATTALVIYGTMMGAQAATQGAGNIARGIGARLGFGRNGAFSETVMDAAGNASARTGYGATTGGQIFGKGMRNSQVNAMYREANAMNKGAGGKGATNALVAVTNSIDLLKKGATGAASGIKNGASAVASGLSNMFSALGKAKDSGRLGTALFNGLKSGISSVLAPLGTLISGFGAFAIPIVVIAAIIAVLILRFNKLLGAMTGGMNIMDILVGTWHMLMGAMKGLADYISNSWIGSVLGAVGAFFDGILTWLGKAAAANVEFQRAQANRQAGSAVFGGSAGVFDSNGNIVEARVNANGQNPDGTQRRGTVSALQGGRILRAKKDVTDADRAAAYRNGQWVQEGVDPATPTGQRSPLPAQTGGDKNKNKGPKDPWPEFLRDLNLKIQAVTDLRDIAPGLKDIQSGVNENLRRAMDVMNFDSSGFTSLSEAWTAFSKENADKAAKVNDLNNQLKNERLVEAMRDLTDGLTDTLITMRRDLRDAGLTDYAAQLAQAKDSVFDQFLASGAFTGKREDYDMFRQMEANGGIAVSNPVMEGQTPDDKSYKFKDYFKSDDDYQRYLDAIENQRDLITSKAVAGKQKEIRLSNQAFVLEQANLQYFGKARDMQDEINSLTNDYVASYGELDHTTGQYILKNAEISAQLAAQIELVRRRAQAERDYQSQYKNGFMEAITEYGDGLNNLADQTKTIFSNALQGLEDGFVNMFTATDLSMDDIKSGMHDLLSSIQADIARLFVKQFIMKPINNMIEGVGKKLFGMSDPDQTINAQNVYINGQGLGSMLGGASGAGGIGGLNLGNLFGQGKPESAFNGGGWLGGITGGGSAGLGGNQAGSGIMSGLMGMLKGGMGKAKGGIGSIVSMLGNFLPPPFNMLSKVFSLFHGGGTVGQSTMQRIVHPGVFSGARRYHTGGTAGLPALAVNEVPAILQRGEKVLTASQYSAMNNSSGNSTFAPNINVNYTSNGGSSSDGNEGSADHAKNVSAMVKAAVNEAIMDYDTKQRKPGSPGYLANRRG